MKRRTIRLLRSLGLTRLGALAAAAAFAAAEAAAHRPGPSMAALALLLAGELLPGTLGPADRAALAAAMLGVLLTL